jgi:DNA-binding beta-propeller fold protein YncE
MNCRHFLCLSSTCILITLSPLSLSKNVGLVTDIFNSDKVEYGAISTGFGLYVTRKQGLWGKKGKSTIVEIDPLTSREKLVSFSHKDFSDSDPFYDKKGKRICFISTRPRKSGENENHSGDIWCADRKINAWGKPYRLSEPVNSIAREYSPVFDDAGQLYFASDRKGGFGQGDVYSARAQQSGVSDSWTVTNMGAAINTPFGEWNVGVRPDGKALLFEASARPENRSIPGDLYYSELIEDQWSDAVATSRLNSFSSDLMARWQGNGDIIYASARKGNGDVDLYLGDPRNWMPIKPSLLAVSRSRAEIVVLDPKSLEVQIRVKVGVGPHEIAFSDDGRTAIVPSLGIYPEPHDMPVSLRPPFITKPSEGLAIVDLVTGDVRQIQLPNCQRPHGVATDNQATRFWITCEAEGKIVEFDTVTLTQKREFKVDIGVHKVFFAQDILIASNPDKGEIYRIELQTGKLSRLATGKGAEGLVVSQDNQTLWVANSQASTVCKVKLKSMIKKWCTDTGGAFPIALALIETENVLWVSRFGTSDIVLLSTPTGEKLDTFPLPTGALGLAVNQDESIVYATLPRHNQVIALDVKNHQIVASSERVMEGDVIKLVR